MGTRNKMRARPHLEGLEDRFAPAVLEVVGSGGDGVTTFNTFPQAYFASNSSSDIIQIEPSAGDIGSISYNPGSNKAHTLQGDPNFASAPSVEAVDNLQFGGVQASLIHLYINGTITVLPIEEGGVIYQDHIGGYIEPGPSGNQGMTSDNTLSHDEITGNVVIGGGIHSTDTSFGDQVLNCDFKSGAQLQIGNDRGNLDSGFVYTEQVTVSDTRFEPSPLTSIVITDATAVIVLRCTISVTTAADAVSVNSDFNATVNFKQDDIHSRNGTGIHVAVSSRQNFSGQVPPTAVGLVIEGTAFQGSSTAVSLTGNVDLASNNFESSYLDAGGGGNSIGGNEFTGSNMTTAIIVNDPAITANHLTVSANDDALGPGVTAVTIASGAVAVNQGMNLTQSQAFVQGLYHVYLLHTAGIDELNAWVNALPALGNAGVSYNIAHSQEGLTRLVNNLYHQLLGRQADGGGQAGLVRFLQGGATEEQAIAILLDSAEFAARANSLAGTPGSSANLNFVRALYNVLLGRTNESSAEDTGWLNFVNAEGKGAMVAAFLASAEFRNDYVDALYTSYTALPANSFFGAVADLLCRLNPPSQAESNSWANSNLNMQNIVVSISASSEFFSNR